jgi:hypothetical protein
MEKENEDEEESKKKPITVEIMMVKIFLNPGTKQSI